MIFSFWGGPTMICGGGTSGGGAEGGAEGGAGATALIRGGGEGMEGTVLCAGIVTQRRGGGGGWVGLGEEEGLDGAAQGQYFVLAIFS